MPRSARRKSSSGYLHLIVRGNNKQIIFEDDDETFDRPELEDVKIGNEEINDATEPYQYNQDTTDITGLIPKRYLVDEEEK